MKGALEDYLEEYQEELLESHDIICTLPNVARVPYKIGSSLDVALRLDKFEEHGNTFIDCYKFVLFPFSALCGYGTSLLEIIHDAPYLAIGSAGLGTFFTSQFLGLEAVKSRRYNHKIASLLFSGECRKVIGEVTQEHKEKTQQMFEEDIPFAKKQHVLEIIDKPFLPESKEYFQIEIDVKKWDEKFGKSDEEWIKIMADEVYSFLGCNYELPAIERNKDICWADYVRQGIGLIRIPHEWDPCLLPLDFAHELAHHCQRPSSRWRPRAVEEGFANAVEFIAVDSYAMKAGDRLTAWMNHGSANRALFALKAMYSGKYKPAKDVIVYDVGTAAFLAAEKMHGRGIYREVLNAEKPAKLLVEMLRGRR